MSTNVPLIESEKAPIPMLWLDTSVYIKLAKIRRGEKLQDVEIERGRRLSERIRELVLAGKLLCPEADHEEEYEGKRLDSEIANELSNLSLGITLQHRQGVKDSQILLGMKAYISSAPSLKIPASIYFHEDPVQQLKAIQDRGCFIVPKLGRPKELLESSDQAKKDVRAKWEELRKEYVSKGQTYDAQLELEQRGQADAMMLMIERFQENYRTGKVSFMEYMSVVGFFQYLSAWRGWGGKPPDFSGLHAFICSDYYHRLPVNRIGRQLGAELLTSEQPILSGDSMDVEMLSVALPIAHFVLTDKKMETRLKKLHIDSDHKTRVFSMSSVDGLFSELEELN